MKRLFSALALMALFSVACGVTSTLVNEATQQAEATATQIPTATDTLPPPPTDTPLPTDTPIPPTPTATEPPFLFRDDFEGALAEGWQWIGEDPTHWDLSSVPGALRITLQSTNIFDGEPKNFLVHEAPNGDYEIATLVHFNPSSNFQFAGLLIYQSQGNALQFGRAFAQCPDVCIGNAIYFDIIEGGKGGKPNYATAAQSLDQAYLRLRREGNIYTGYYSEDGTDWIVIGKHESGITPVFVGLIASQGYQVETTADFDYFTIEALP